MPALTRTYNRFYEYRNCFIMLSVHRIVYYNVVIENSISFYATVYNFC